jgi:ubiquinone/menaquinone biosynthesis C-methylase UbiE
MIDGAALRHVPDRLGRPPRVLDVACGTGILLRMLTELVPTAEGYGVDASPDMLAQARGALAGRPRVRLERVEVDEGPTAGLPYAPETFDLITCTNTLHDFANAAATLSGLRRLLAPGGQLVLEDFTWRTPPLTWKVLGWLDRRIEKGYGHAYTLVEALSLCRHSRLCVACSQTFSVNWLWNGWALRASATPAGAAEPLA